MSNEISLKELLDFSVVAAFAITPEHKVIYRYLPSSKSA